MTIVVLGASGRTGLRVVARALVAGQQVRACSRNPGLPLLGTHDRLLRLPTDVLDGASVAAAVQGLGTGDAVLSALGVPATREEVSTYSTGIGHLLQALGPGSPVHVSAVSAAPVGDRSSHPWHQRRLVMPALDRFFGTGYADLARMEDALAAGDPSWTVLRPPRLVAREGDTHRWSTDGPLPRGSSLTFDALAAALLGSPHRPEWARTVVHVAR